MLSPAPTSGDAVSGRSDPTPAWVVLLGVVAASLIVLGVMNPHLIVAANTPSGGDMGAHVLAPAYLRDALLPTGRVLGWSNSWFAGFPIFYFYFPLPSLVIVLLDTVLPYGVAFKVVTVLGLLAMPPAAYVLARSLRFSRLTSMMAAAAAAAFVFMESYTIYGGNIASTLAGEFSYSWSFALSLVYLGLLIRAVRDDRKWVPWAAAALAAAALSHVLTTMIVVLASVPILLWRHGAKRAPVVWGWGFAIAGFWALPLVIRIGLTSDMAWSPLREWYQLFPVEIWIMLLPAAVGAVWGLRRTVRLAPVIFLTLIPLLYYWLPILLPAWLPEIFTNPRWKLWNGRWLPFWYFGVYFLGGIGAGLGLQVLLRRLPERLSAWWPRMLLLVGGGVAYAVVSQVERAPRWAAFVALVPFAIGLLGSVQLPSRVMARSMAALVGVVVIAGGGLAGVSFVDGWARWNYVGYEGKEGWAEYQALMTQIDQLPPGRVQWEANSELNRYGTPMALMLFPYWSETHPSMEGLFFESSITTPFHFLNAGETSFKPSNPIPGLRYHSFDLDRGLAHLAVYDVRYYVTFTDEAEAEAEAHPALAEVGRADPFVIWELPAGSLVDVASKQPAVYQPETVAAASSQTVPAPARPLTFNEFALEWYDDLELLDRWVVEEGPADWPRVGSVSEVPDLALAGSGAVTDVRLEDHRISFTTTAVGLPHLVKVSYFPNWTAEGAEGPFRATPSLMVVIPTESDVVLEFRRTAAENVGMGLTVIGLALLALSGWRRRKAA